uniref:Solute carrier family 25 member 45 n=1 Tax=Arion vulgaris TaxID=1028688 RepID=A0A0B6ZH58_9EUPU
MDDRLQFEVLSSPPTKSQGRCNNVCLNHTISNGHDDVVASQEYVMNVNEYVAGAAGGASGVMIGHPFDTIKLQMQIRTTLNHKFERTMDAFTSVASQGFKNGLFRGMLFPVASYGLVNSIFFGVYGNTLRMFEPDTKIQPTNSQVYMAGCVAGTFQLIVACPVEVIKCTLQAQIPCAMQTSHVNPIWRAWPVTSKQFYKGPVECTIQIFKYEGFKGFYKGLFAMFVRDFPSYGLYLMCYEILHRYLINHEYSDKKGVIAALVAGGLAGAASWLSIMPLDAIKSRLQASTANISQVDHEFRYKGFWDCATRTVKRGGFRVLYRGTFITILRALPVNGVTFLVYSQLLKELNIFNPP